MFAQLNFPQYKFKIEKRLEEYYVWDQGRKKWLLLTPEEWVRQHILAFFKQELNIPYSYMHCEHPIQLGENTQRADIVVYNKSGIPKIVVECKAPTIKIDQSVVDQATRYNYQLQAQYLIVSNGLQHLVYDINKQEKKLLECIPNWEAIQ